MTLGAMEKLLIADALRRHDGNRNKAARELGINPSTLFRKLRDLKLDAPDFAARCPESVGSPELASPPRGFTRRAATLRHRQTAAEASDRRGHVKQA